MSDAILRKRLARSEARIRVLEHDIEERTRELYVALLKDVEAAEFVQDVMSAVPSAVFVFDGKGIIRHVNQAAGRLLGVGTQALVGEPIDQFFPPGEAPTVESIMAALAGSATPVARADQNCLSTFGERIPIHLSAALLRAGENEPLATRRAVAVAIDLRESRQLEVELRQAQKLEAVGRLAAGVAHEINTPVQFVNDSIVFLRDASQDIAELMRRHQRLIRDLRAGTAVTAQIAAVEAWEEEIDLAYIAENVPQAFERAIDGLNRVASIVRSMKEFSHPDTKERKLVDLNRGIESVITLARNEYKYVADVTTAFGGIPQVLCHGGEINQVLLNLVINAAHAIADRVGESGDRGTIHISTAIDNDQVRISIADTGTGIPEDIRDRIFDPFFTTKDVGRGTGQGLAFARSMIVERHCGTLDFDTEEGTGTTFHIRLPVACAIDREAA